MQAVWGISVAKNQHNRQIWHDRQQKLLFKHRQQMNFWHLNKG
ncbi:MAG: hypothetical protein ACHBN1_38630 [Heteroscytonema crispum UTEX LB 1556]